MKPSLSKPFLEPLLKPLLKIVTGVSLPLLLATSLSAHSTCLTAPELTGINLAGAEFNSKRLPGEIFKDYTYPSSAELKFAAAQGANVIRLPIRWERVRNEAMGPLNAAELNFLRKTIDTAKSEGLCVIIDIHNFAKYYADNLKDKPELQDAFVDLWVRLANEFDDVNSTAFGLMNEPIHLPLPAWADLAKRTLKALRKADSKNLVVIAGGHWSGMHDWFNQHDGKSNAEAFADLDDPLNRTIIEVHQYADEHYSGTKLECLASDHFTSPFERIAKWAREHDQQLFLGEFGVPNNEICLRTLARFMSLIHDSGNVWRGWSYWAGGSWWGDYAYALNTDADNPSPQWKILKQHFYNQEDKPSPPKAPANPTIEEITQ